MTRFITIISFLLVLMLVPSSSNAQKLYISTDIGLGIGSSFDTDANDTDFPTLCDKHVDPGNLFSSEGVTEPEGCSDEGSTWSNSFDGSTGIIAGVALGFSTNFGARIEAEYFNLGTQYNEKSILTFEGVGPDVQKWTPMLGQFFRFLKCIPTISKPLLVIHEADHSKPDLA